MIKEWSNIQQLTKQAQRRAELQGADPVRKNENFKNKKIFFFLMSQGSLNPKIRSLGQKV